MMLRIMLGKQSRSTLGSLWTHSGSNRLGVNNCKCLLDAFEFKKDMSYEYYPATEDDLNTKGISYWVRNIHKTYIGFSESLFIKHFVNLELKREGILNDMGI